MRRRGRQLVGIRQFNAHRSQRTGRGVIQLKHRIGGAQRRCRGLNGARLVRIARFVFKADEVGHGGTKLNVQHAVIHGDG